MFSFAKKSNGIAVEESSLHDGLAIFEKIKSKINDAEYSIKIAAAWFTDNDLFQELVLKLKNNLNFKIEIVLDDNKENYWLPFMDLVNSGATVKLSKGLGMNGRMHDKFCIIDDRFLINGSYNWSKNARNENYENVILTSHPQVLNEFKEKFQRLIDSSSLYQSINLDGNTNKEEASLILDKSDSFTKEFENVLDEMIFSTIVEFNRDSLVAMGFERSEKCSGDSNIITNELNTVHSQLLNSISVAENKKEILLAKVNTHFVENKGRLLEKLDQTKEELKLDEEIERKNLNIDINSINEQNTRMRDEIIKIEKTDIPNNNIKILELTKQEKEIREDNIRMPFRWYTDIPAYLGLVLVFFYIVLFYSSAAYILVFSERDANIAKKLGAPVEEMSIYYGHAITKAFQNGFTEIFFILLVPTFLVLGIIYLKKLQISKIWKGLSKFTFLVLVDGFTALAVTKSIHNSNYLAGLESERFKISGIFYEMDFYLIFIFGLLSLVIFDLIVSYVMRNLESRSSFHINIKKKVQLENIIKERNDLLEENNIYQTNLETKEKQIKDNLVKISSIEKEIESLPGITKRKETLHQNETTNEIINLENIVKIAINKIENELFSFSDHHMRDRINIFLQGWNNFIYSYFSTAIAERKINEAKTNSNNWFQEYFFKKNK